MPRSLVGAGLDDTRVGRCTVLASLQAKCWGCFWGKCASLAGTEGTKLQATHVLEAVRMCHGGFAF